MKYEIRYYYREDEDPLDSTATLDHARTLAAKLSLRPKDLGATLIILAFENGRRTPRSFACAGRVYWPATCRECDGKGHLSKHSKCYDCQCYGAVVDENTGAAA